MIIQFHIHFKTTPQESLAVRYFRENEEDQVIHMQSYDGENWLLSMDADETNLEYKYILFHGNEEKESEWGSKRVLNLSAKKSKYYYVNDFWRSREHVQNAFLTSAFTEAIFSRKTTGKNKTAIKNSAKNILEITMTSTLPDHLTLGIIGNIDLLGKWLKPVQMDGVSYPTWKVSMPIDSYEIFIQYKFVILEKSSGEIVEWEVGENRVFKRFLPEVDRYTCIVNDQHFKYGQVWKGAGVAIPIFSLRSQQGLGIGEFSDLIPLADWAKSVSLRIIQVLPVNDTIANKTWQDSYPYAAISVFALHPLYINIEKIAAFEDKNIVRQLAGDKKKLNEPDQIDFEKVLERKMFYFTVLFQENKDTFFSKKEVKTFLSENDFWLPAYAAFCALRDTYNTCRYDEWPLFSEYDKNALDDHYQNNSSFREKFDFYVFLQFHAHQQLTDARNHARSLGIALKGDLPIGIYRYSCDAWVDPRLYNMDEQAGAPPDDFSELGQNWGFPTYNWEEMAKDGYDWWKNRMKKLNEYFDALRIDHILGFFRIWQIPARQVSGTLGLFNPRIPYHRDEIIQSGLTGPIERFTKPFLTEELVLQYFSTEPACIDTFFDKKEGGMYAFKDSFKDQKAIQDWIYQNPAFKEKEPVLMKLFTEVIFLEENVSGQMMYNPRITVHTTYSFKCLDENQKNIVKNLYNHYYFKRHDEFWKKQALKRLPALLDASNMLICGEDLGMIPNTVPEVMRALNIMSLEIQRMPKGDNRFGNVQTYPYYSVSSPSCHDMSTIRGWWENDHEMAKEYYYQYMQGHGYTPMKCEARIVQYIVEDHLAGPSMLAVFPLQDLLGMDADLRKLDAASEQINEPSNPKHYWRFRFHMDIEKLCTQDTFNQKLRTLINKYRHL